MDIQLVKHERKGDVVCLTLNNPGNMNALSLPMLEALEGAIDTLYRDETTRCVVITGEGKAFCAGGDLRGFQADLAEPTTDRFLDRLRYAQVVFDKIEALPMPVIAAVNGYAIAGGLELILCCDMIVAAESARIGDGHARYGIIPAGGSTARLPRKISANRANYMLLTAELFPAQTLEQWGLVNCVVPDSELDSTVIKLSKSISAHSPLGLSVIKGLARTSMKTSAEDAARAEIAAFEEYATSHDFAEGLAAFAEKRKPAFNGH
ncbi:enoyl-CoA hydratase/isomerase family protein [Noviherbaspirillum sp. Root189]|uniref:enoyl-CoA hydratase/isomerase family protein n=1 Tax=Noviherbaspirillum sp. Root189 TaxID=1736487 RepID=UPI000709C4D5|nr:enoyl-CoA hydratase/isomerase family protein [Noviherbaspirillum sp. Root189]KRB85119.1 enoyl-CoA hydratase [Noviherbaspirillum sp. Root189]